MTFVAMVLVAYVSGAVPWSVWLGGAVFGVDPRAQGDGNPGATNAFHAAGWRLGVPVMLLDYFKGALPVVVAHWGLMMPDDQLFWVACAPTLGHAFSVFLRFDGGRALAAMFGVWTGLTLYRVPLVLALTAIIGTRVFPSDDLKSLALPLAVIIFLLVSGYPLWMLGVAVVQLVVLVSKMAHYRWRTGSRNEHVPA